MRVVEIKALAFDTLTPAPSLWSCRVLEIASCLAMTAAYQEIRKEAMKPVGITSIVEIGPSRLLGLFLCSTHLIALVVVIDLSRWYHPLCLFLVLPLLWSCVSGWTTYVTLSVRGAVGRVEWGADDGWTLVERRGGRVSAELVGRSFVAPWMTLLSFSCQSGFRRHVILLDDNSDADQVRRLRVRLRLNRH